MVWEGAVAELSDENLASLASSREQLGALNFEESIPRLVRIRELLVAAEDSNAQGFMPQARVSNISSMASEVSTVLEQMKAFDLATSDAGTTHRQLTQQLSDRLEQLLDAIVPFVRVDEIAAATLQLGAQEQLANVSKLLGHANLSTTADLYAHLAPATERRAADMMDRLLA